MDKRCVLPGCDREMSYTTLGLCRSCYNRVSWFSRRHDKSLEEALVAVKELDALLIKHGIADHGRPKSPHKKLISSRTPAAKKGHKKRGQAHAHEKAES